ncbi:MAG: hypothetical protein WA807_12005 [Steroidobacteraceae bacterium]
MTMLILVGLCTAAVAQPSGAPPPSYQPVPAPPAETIPPPPPQGVYIWRPGHWVWNGYAYRWKRGAYVSHEPKMHVWVNGAWVIRGGVRVWVPPHWQ